MWHKEIKEKYETKVGRGNSSIYFAISNLEHGHIIGSLGANLVVRHAIGVRGKELSVLARANLVSDVLLRLGVGQRYGERQKYRVR